MLRCAHVCKMAYACTLLYDSIQSDNNNTAAKNGYDGRPIFS